MREDEFRRWLRDVSGLEEAPQINGLSRCRRIEAHEGNLDEHYSSDRMESLVARLTYSADDEKKRAKPRHSIYIAGSVRNGTSSLKNAAVLYRRFRDGVVPQAKVITTAIPPSIQKSFLSTLRTDVVASLPQPKNLSHWPEWNLPTRNETLQLARLTVPYIRFLKPDVVRALVNDNEIHISSWSRLLSEKGIQPSIYLWERCSCAFPGIRRYAGSTEIAQHRGRSTSSEALVDALKLDDNHYPKQMWSFLVRGKPFQNIGPNGYALAHLTDHKNYKNRSETEFETVSEASTKSTYGLYTCATNTAYMPVTLIKPTDFAGPLRNLLQRRAEFLYGEFCNVVPPHLKVRDAESGAWSLDAFDWSEPVGSLDFLPLFLQFRQQKMNELLVAPKDSS